jgi:hypothetical protein
MGSGPFRNSGELPEGQSCERGLTPYAIQVRLRSNMVMVFAQQPSDAALL